MVAAMKDRLYMVEVSTHSVWPLETDFDQKVHSILLSVRSAR